MSHLDLGDAGRLQGQIERLLNVRGRHGLEPLPGNDVARVVIQDRGQVIPAPADHTEIGEVGLPEFVHTAGGMLELVAGRHHDVRRAGDQVAPLQNPVYAGFRDKVALGVGDLPGQLAG